VASKQPRKTGLSVVPEGGTWAFNGNGATAGYVAPDYLAEVVDHPGLACRTTGKINQRLAILEPNSKKMKKFPALKAAYENYKITEGLTFDDKD